MGDNYKGIIIEESLENKDVLKGLNVISTKVEQVKEEHKTPWVKQWTMRTVEIPEEHANEVAEKLSNAIDSQHNWYADFKNEEYHYIIFRNKIFKVQRTSKAKYDEVVRYGLTLGIPDYQLDFSPHIKQWGRSDSKDLQSNYYCITLSGKTLLQWKPRSLRNFSLILSTLEVRQ